MCHGHPRRHPCGHLSINWYYCPSAFIDLQTGIEGPCGNVSFAPTQRSNLDCPLQYCDFKGKEGRWLCCVCKQGPNFNGWCLMPRRDVRPNRDTLVMEEFETTCDHGCCKKCQKLEPSGSPSPEVTIPELRKGSSRKSGYGATPRSHRRSTYSIVTPSFATPERDRAETSTATPSSGSSGHAGYKIELDYRPTKPAKRSHAGNKRYKTRAR